MDTQDYLRISKHNIYGSKSIASTNQWFKDKKEVNIQIYDNKIELRSVEIDMEENIYPVKQNKTRKDCKMIYLTTKLSPLIELGAYPIDYEESDEDVIVCYREDAW